MLLLILLSIFTPSAAVTCHQCVNNKDCTTVQCQGFCSLVMLRAHSKDVVAQQCYTAPSVCLAAQNKTTRELQKRTIEEGYRAQLDLLESFKVWICQSELCNRADSFSLVNDCQIQQCRGFSCYPQYEQQGQGFVPEPPSADYDTIQSQQIEQDIAYLRKKEKSNTDKPVTGLVDTILDPVKPAVGPALKTVKTSAKYVIKPVQQFVTAEAKPTTAKVTTIKPATADITTIKPATVKPTTAKPNTAKPTTAKPTTAKPTTVKPATIKPTTAKPTTAKPTTVKPTPAKPPTAKPTTAKLTTAKPTTAKPTTAKPKTAKPATVNPTTTKHATAKHATIKPTTAKPTTAKPTPAKPATVKPTTAKPTTAKPTTAKPTTAKPTTAKPTTAKPTTIKPTTVKPTTVKPATAKPATAKPTTVKPTSAKPTPAKPATVKRTPAKPATVKPTTIKPITAKPTMVKPPTANPATIKLTTIKLKTVMAEAVKSETGQAFDLELEKEVSYSTGLPTQALTGVTRTSIEPEPGTASSGVVAGTVDVHSHCLLLIGLVLNFNL